MPLGYKARAEQVMVITVTAWDANCQRHVPVLWDVSRVQNELAARAARSAELGAQLCERGSL